MTTYYSSSFTIYFLVPRNKSNLHVDDYRHCFTSIRKQDGNTLLMYDVFIFIEVALHKSVPRICNVGLNVKIKSNPSNSCNDDLYTNFDNYFLKIIANSFLV